MSELRVALVAEGPTDAIVIQAALKALLPAPFVLTQLQPEPTRPKFGGGWGGVLRWCLDFASRGYARLEDDPTLPGFDLFVLHVDADVAEYKYADVSPEIESTAKERGWPALPCKMPCPPPDGGVTEVRRRLLTWAELEASGPNTVICVPSKSSEAWLTAALFAENHPLMSDLECNLRLEAQLKNLRVGERIKKTTREYRMREKRITEAWATVRQRCTQAERFSAEVLSVGL